MGVDFPGKEQTVKIITLLENTAYRETLCAAHGLSLYIETPRRKILFDMGPNADFVANAEALGVDLAAVDLAILSHGHYDHGGGLAAFCRVNVGLPQGLEDFRDRFILTAGETVIDDELTLFSEPPAVFDAMSASAGLREQVGEDYPLDTFRHEQDLLIRAAGKTAVVAGCAHRGVVNILAAAKAYLGEDPDALFGGFHLFELRQGDPTADALIDATGKALLPGKTVYYTGHCTGAYAYERLSAILGERLRPLTGGSVAEI